MFDTFWLVQLLRVSPLVLCMGAVSIIAVRDALLRAYKSETAEADRSAVSRLATRPGG